MERINTCLTDVCVLTASILYTAVVRGKVALPCDITPPAPDDTVALILWYKDDALTPIFTLDSRKGQSRVCVTLLMLVAGLLDQARTLTASALDGECEMSVSESVTHSLTQRQDAHTSTCTTGRPFCTWTRSG